MAAGGVPLIISPVVEPSYAARALDGMDGLLLTGGEDIDPAWYSADPSPHLYPPSREREALVALADGLRSRNISAFTAARERELPILGICRGIQLVNVGLGGTLYQDLPAERPGPVDHNPSAERTARSHVLLLEEGSRAASALGATRLSVNSFHHQPIRDLAAGLVVSGVTEDGVIEAVESPAAAPWLLAVQWHPEEMHADGGAPERGLFKALIAAAGEREALAP